MLAAIEGMIAELRQIGVPVSLAERIDAVHSLRHLPVGDRATVKAALRAVLVKTHDHELAFDAVFDLYFTAQPAQAAPGPGHSGAAEPGQDGQGVQGGLNGQNGHGGGERPRLPGRRGPDRAAADRPARGQRGHDARARRHVRGPARRDRAGPAGGRHLLRVPHAAGRRPGPAAGAAGRTRRPGPRARLRPAGAAAGARGLRGPAGQVPPDGRGAGPAAPGRRPRRRGRGPHPAQAAAGGRGLPHLLPRPDRRHARRARPAHPQAGDPAGGQAPPQAARRAGLQAHRAPVAEHRGSAGPPGVPQAAPGQARAVRAGRHLRLGGHLRGLHPAARVRAAVAVLPGPQLRVRGRRGRGDRRAAAGARRGRGGPAHQRRGQRRLAGRPVGLRPRPDQLLGRLGRAGAQAHHSDRARRRSHQLPRPLRGRAQGRQPARRPRLLAEPRTHLRLEQRRLGDRPLPAVLRRRSTSAATSASSEPSSRTSTSPRHQR